MKRYAARHPTSPVILPTSHPEIRYEETPDRRKNYANAGTSPAIYGEGIALPVVFATWFPER